MYISFKKEKKNVIKKKMRKMLISFNILHKIERYQTSLKFLDPECYQLVYNARGKNTTLKPTESTPDNTINR